MSALTRLFFRPSYLAPSTGAILAWWESRRVVYNLTVGGAGLTSLVAITLFNVLPPHGRLGGAPWQGVVAYAVLANVFYCAGPVLDLFIVRRWGTAYASVGPALFRYGFAFAVGLSLLPVPVAVMGWVARLLTSG